ncbi:hypothetical protein AGMMS49949_06610 [Alphaproteobacteria bacterium]|nr:hypothetical protein AGMMS49949_06610 [Alphaproteobacteria bacterium]GHS98436.1 hypothetical protein AGMMS50296_6100 [Alphaproteobacteria bacterium]
MLADEETLNVPLRNFIRFLVSIVGKAALDTMTASSKELIRCALEGEGVL